MSEMKALTVLLMALLLTPAVWAASHDESAARALLTVRIHDNSGLSGDDIIAAQTAADGIFRAAGIQLAWIQCPYTEARRQHSSARCATGVGPDDLVVRILRSPPQDFASRPVPLGEAQVGLQTHTGSYATVFADRVAIVSGRAGTNPTWVLGRVIAHEIGHLLLGSNSHAEHGLMRPVWTDKELLRPVGLEWHFSASEARRIHEGIVERAARAGM